jgi:hypothetical protein
MMSDNSLEDVMIELLTQPPPAEALAKITSIEGVRIAPTVLTTQQGPDRHLGPEAAGAVLILQATFVDEQSAAGFWLKVAELFERLAVAPGFIRRFSFFDGPHGYLIALWRTSADAHAFFSSESIKRRCASSTASVGSTRTSPRFGRWVRRTNASSSASNVTG